MLTDATSSSSVIRHYPPASVTTDEDAALDYKLAAFVLALLMSTSFPAITCCCGFLNDSHH